MTIGMWEYIRHEFLLPYISMELGNWLAPLLVLIVTLLFLTKLFSMIEQIQEELNRSRAVQAVLEEREKIARELHDGIAQSLFFLNTLVARMERLQQPGGLSFDKLKESVHRTNDYVRQAIANLRRPAETHRNPWLQSMESLMDELRRETDIQFDSVMEIPDLLLIAKEKVELMAIIREALLNSYKHAEATRVLIKGTAFRNGWRCEIIDNGKGFDPETVSSGNRYGLKMMRDRANNMQWSLQFEREAEETKVIVIKEAT
ncbi:sensor histidine kinase [Paenibacillus sp. NPDC058071]|uniref:sensor histidine kinase n=1 Tax=Paenibacillus sp. NPDC058071 TaxID=3346326 RepID=UPI0036D7845D